MKHFVLATMLALGCAQALQAETVQAEKATSKPETFMDQFSVHGTLTLSSDYRSRGFSKSDQKPSVQGGLILAHQSGVYLMLWGASATTPNEGSIEADAILGYTWRINDKNSLDFFYADVNYPGGNFSPNGKSADFGEYGVMYKRTGTFVAQDNFSAAVYYSQNYLFGSGNEYYFSSEYSFPVVENVQLFGSAGYTKQDSVAEFQLGSVPDGKKSSYFDYKVGVRGDYKGVTTELAWVGNNIESQMNMYDDRLYVSVTKNF
ncbi:TorF family putative porin [Acinetobacter guillouiae]|uniref:TorF family putative porin n=1 Tax=Acinetobacter guillouiae TaxID=106649 RepID=UPI00125F8B98|nr:TorF family putative porin [Acinetobacter guillouiae]